MSLNVRGMRDMVKRKAIFLFCKSCESDLIFLQETHSCESDVKFWKNQWGNLIYSSHGSNHSAGVSILLHKFKGQILETAISNEGRWIIMALKQDNSIFVVCNLYGYNSFSANKTLFSHITQKIIEMQIKYPDSFLILGGDFNECLDNTLDRFPPRSNEALHVNSNNILSICSSLSLTDPWRFFHPDTQDFTWSNSNLTLKSRIDFFLLSSSALQFVKDVNHSFAPLTDHNQIILKLGCYKENPKLRGYWKFNNCLLKDDVFNNNTKELIKNILLDKMLIGYKNKWEFFKYRVRQIAIKRSKELKNLKNKKITEQINRINTLLTGNLSEKEKIELKELHLQINQAYLDIARGAFVRSRAKWLEEGEANSSYFFALEKRNCKRNSLTSLNINGVKCTDPKLISNFVTDFYQNIYTSAFDKHCSDHYVNKIKTCVPVIDPEFKTFCDSNLTLEEIQVALYSMKKGKSPGNDGLTVEFYMHFWELIKDPLLSMYDECIDLKDMTTSMKQGVICLIPKPDKDTNLIDNWRPITLLTVDYKILALIFANRLKTKINQLVAETQSGFVKGRHISNNIRLALDLLDYADFIHSKAMILFLDFYKAFDTLEHGFLLQTLKLFGFGDFFVNAIEMLYSDISSSVLISFNTSKRFSINRGVRQGCPISPFLFILVTELLSLNIIYERNLEGISIFDREIKISQLADDTALFLKDKCQLSKAISIIEEFSCASGLKLNMSKCEIMMIHETNDSSLNGILVKETVKYLGIYLTKNFATRQQLNFSGRLKKTHSIFNLWLQRDLSLYGRVLLTKAEGLSRLVYPSLSLSVNIPTAKEVNKIFLNFIWKNKSHKLKKTVLANSRKEGGLEVIDFEDIVNTFRINWIKRCLKDPNSIWFFIPNSIFTKIGGLPFILKCNYLPNKLPIALSKFHQQVLLSWKLCYSHNFSPHKCFLWNNSDIRIRNKSIFLSTWFNRNIIGILSIFDKSGNFLSYEQFMSNNNFPLPFKEFNAVQKANPLGLIQLIKSHLMFNENVIKEPELILNGISLFDNKCNNKYIRQIFQNKKYNVPKGKFYWASFLDTTDWKKAWLLPHKYCISNKTKEVHFKILHKIYPVNGTLAKYLEIDSLCTFCKSEDETLIHIFFQCESTKNFWKNLYLHIGNHIASSRPFHLQDVVCYYGGGDDVSENYIIDFFILYGKYFIHKQKFSCSQPSFSHFLIEIDVFIKSLRLVNNKKSDRFLVLYDKYFGNSTDT